MACGIEVRKSCEKEIQCSLEESAPHRNSMNIWMGSFKETGCLNDKPRTGRPRIREETVTASQEAFERNPQKSVRSVLQAPVYKILK